MGKFRKKPVVIEAFQFTKDASYTASNWPQWAIDAFDADRRQNNEGAIWLDDDGWWCGTLEGQHKISFNDWIIQGVQGEIYPCKPDIFHATYEPSV